MNIKIENINGLPVAKITTNEAVVVDAQSVLDIMADCSYHGSECLIAFKNNFHPNFFDLKTGIAGEILQKFSNYSFRMAIVGDFSNVNSKSLNDFIRESNRVGRILFVSSAREAEEKLSAIRI